MQPQSKKGANQHQNAQVNKIQRKEACIKRSSTKGKLMNSA